MKQRQQELLEISRRYAALPAGKRQILKDRLRQNGIDLSQLRMVPFGERADRLPLSHGQERLWFLWRLEPQSGINNVSGAVRLDGEFDRPALLRALRSVVERHESLRMRVEEVDGVAWQVFAAEPELDLMERDLGGLSGASQEAAVQAELREVAAAPFDLERGPLLRARLIRLDASLHVLALAMHHIVSDGWSVGVLLKELSEFYAAAREGRAAKLPDLLLQYGDYALWQREWLDDTALSAQLDYWRTRLGGEQPVLRLPAD